MPAFALETAGTRAVARCDLLGAPPYSESAASLTRRYLTPAHRATLESLKGWMQLAGMTVRRDAMGNLIGRYAGTRADAPALVIGSHIDTVADAGRYDGALGIMIGIEVVAALSSRREHLPFAIEVIAFGDEEGSRFPSSMLCSRAIAGALPEDALNLLDQDGVSLAEALQDFGLDPLRIADAARARSDVLGYIEAHIEQGPVLENERLPVGVVTSIAAQVRFRAVFAGLAGHAGTSPMHLRRDALAAAAAGILAVERLCSGQAESVVGTVGFVGTTTRAFNVIVGEAELYVDVRAGTTAARDAAAARIRDELQRIAAARGVEVSISTVQELPAVPCNAKMTAMLAAAMVEAGHRPFHMMSGAGHDAMVIAPLTAVAMLFIRCAAGISHNRQESVTAADVDVAIRTLLGFIRHLGTAHS